MTRTFVTGAPRSGTSLTCQVLAACGADFGTNLAHANKHNPHGYMEDTALRSRVTKPWLERIGADRIGQWPLPDQAWRPTASEVEAFHADAVTYMRAPYAKDPKILPLWPLFDAAFPDARWVLVRRDAESIAESCLRTRFMMRFETRPEWIRWAHEMAKRIDDAAAYTDAVEVWPDPSDPECFREAVEFCGLGWNRSAVEAVCHPEDWRAA